MPNKITYTITTADGKEHQVSKENVDKYGIQSYADAYKGATIRMRDAQKGDYDIPLQHFDNARKQGLHAFSLEHLPPAPVKQQPRQAAPPKPHTISVSQPTQPASKPTTGGKPMTAAEKAQAMNFAAGIQQGVQRSKQQFDATMQRAKAQQKNPLNVQRVTLGVGGTKPTMTANKRVVQGESKLNAQTGKLEPTYITEAGNVYQGDRTLADAEQNQIDDAKEAQLHPIDHELKEAYAERDRLARELSRRGTELDAEALEPSWRDMPHGSGGAIHTFNSATSNGRLADNEWKALSAAKNQNQQRIVALEAERDKAEAGFWRGVTDIFKNPSLWSFGYTDMLDTSAMLNYGGKKTQRQKDADQAMIENTYKNQVAQSKYGNNRGFMYRAGRMTAQAVPVMIEFAATDGLSGLTQAGAKAGAKIAEKIATKALTKKLIKYTGTTLGDVAAGVVMANTTGAAHTASDIGQRHLGHVEQDGYGNYHFAGGEDWGTAIRKGEIAQGLEYYTEKLGVHLEGLPIGKTIAKGLDKIGLSKVTAALNRAGTSQYAQLGTKVMNRAGVNGYINEVAEEEANIVLNSMLVGDNKMSDLFDDHTQADIWGGMLFSVGAMEAAPKLAGAVDYYRTKKSVKDADTVAAYRMTQEKWQPLRDQIDNATNEEMADVVNGIIQNSDLHEQEKKAALNYAGNLIKFRGFNTAQFTKAKELEETGAKDDETIIHQSMDNAYIQGHEASDEQKNDIKTRYEYAEQQLSEALGTEDVSGYSVDDFLDNKESLNDKQKQAAIDYLNAKSAYNGMISQVKDNIDDAIKASDVAIDNHTHEDGNIYPATMKVDNRKVYVVGGHAQMNEDGTSIDHEKSSDSIMVRDAETGKTEMVAPSAILSVDEATNAEEEKAGAAELIRQSYAQQEANKIDGTLEFNVGDTYSVIGEDNSQHTLQVIGDAVDEKTGQPIPNMVMVSVDGSQQPTMLPKEQVQEMSDSDNMLRLSQSLKQREEAKAAESQSSNTYSLNDEVTLTNEEGTPVRGSITADQNEDGKFEVYTEEPINGKKVNLFSAEELDALNPDVQTNDETQQTSNNEFEGEPAQTESVVNLPQNAETISEARAESEEKSPQEQPSALERIPKDEQGQPIYEQAEPETAWDAIVEQTGGDEAMAQTVADDMVADMEAAVKKAEKTKTKGGTTIAEKIAAEKERSAAIEQAKQTLAHWKKIASTNRMRQAAIHAEKNRKAEETARLRKEQEDKERAEREEAERQKREALNGVPDFVEYKAPDARARGRSENIDGTEANQGGTEGDSGRSEEERVETADEGAYSLSQQKSDNGENFYQDINGNVDLANIPDEVFNKINKPQAPFRLTPSMLKHVFDRHGKEMGLSKADDAIDFVLDVIDNFDHVRQGEKGAIIFSIENGRSRTGRRAVTVLLDSLSGSYYGIKTSGYERIEGLTKRTLLWEKGAKDTSTTGVAPANVSTEQASQSNEPAGSASNHNNDFESKDKQSSDTKQENVDNYLEKPARGEDLFAMAERVAAEDKAKRTRKKEEAKVDTNPTEAQKEAGNYKKGHIKVDGFNVTIEQPKGSVRRGKDANGKEWETEMHNTYGYIRGTESVDGDHIDIFLSDNQTEGNVFVVDQVNKDGSFDEHKVMYGFSDMESARKAYLSNYEEGWQGLGNITEVSKEEFKKWIDSSKRKTKPFAEYKSVRPEMGVGFDTENALSSDNYAHNSEKVHKAINAYEEAQEKFDNLFSLLVKEKESKPFDNREWREVNRTKEELKDVLLQLNTKELSELLKQVSEKDTEYVIKNVLDIANRQEHRLIAFNEILDKQSHITPEYKEGEKAIPVSEFVETDKKRAEIYTILTGVFHDKGYVVGTDAYLLLARKEDYDKSLEGKVTNKKGEVINGKYPNWRAVVNSGKQGKSWGVNLEELHAFTRGVLTKLKTEKANPSTKKDAKIAFKTADGKIVLCYANALDKALQGAKSIGAKSFFGNDDVFAITQTPKGYVICPMLNQDQNIDDNSFAYVPRVLELQHSTETLSNDTEAKQLATGGPKIHQAKKSQKESNVFLSQKEYIEKELVSLLKQTKYKTLEEWEDKDTENYAQKYDDILETYKDYVRDLVDDEKLQAIYDKSSVKTQKEIREHLTDADLDYHEFINTSPKRLRIQDRLTRKSKYAKGEFSDGTIVSGEVVRWSPTSLTVNSRGTLYTISANKVLEQSNEPMNADGHEYQENGSLQYSTEELTNNTTAKRLATDTILSALNKAGIEVVRATDEQVQELLANTHATSLRTPQGTIYGWAVDGKIYLTEAGINPDTPIHEYTHLWAEAMKTKNKKGWNSIKALLKETPVWNEVVADPNYSNITNDEDAVASEVLSRISGRENAARMVAEAQKVIDEAEGVLEKAKATTMLLNIKEALRNFWEWIGKSIFNIRSFSSIDEVTDKILYDLVNATRLNANKNKSIIGDDNNEIETAERDRQYLEAVQRGDMDTARRLVNEAAERNGYTSNSDYQGTSAFNGAAPYGNGYFFSREKRKEAYENDEFDGDTSLDDYINSGIDPMNLDFLTSDSSYRHADDARKEAIKNLRNVIKNKRQTITMYRSVPSSVKEGSFRNGDWITPSYAYAVENARVHGWGRDFRIIEQEVPIDEVWFDGNDIAEFGYGNEDDFINDKDYLYSNTKNNRKLPDVVTYDDNRNIIPLSKRFNKSKGDPRFQIKKSVLNEEKLIVEKAKADGTYMKAPNGKPTKLNERQWIQVRTQTFKSWFGDWEKAARIEKLHNSKPIKITGEEIEPSDNLKQYKKNALEYGKNLRGEYTNEYTKEVIALTGGNSRGGIREILQHDYKDIEHLQSIAAIPQIIKKSIFIDEIPNEDAEKYSDIKSFRYYVSGLKIGKNDYTIKAVVAVQNNGDRYYDHKLSSIEKGKLLSIIPTIQKAGIKNNLPPSIGKDKRLLSILQTNSSKVVDENGEPMVVYHGTLTNGLRKFSTDFIGSRYSYDEKGFFFISNRRIANDYSISEFNASRRGEIIDAYVSLRNPLVVNSEWCKKNGLGSNVFKDNDVIEFWDNYQSLMIEESERNDGVIITDGETSMVVAFDPNQIKSATENNGNFSTLDDDIRYRSIFGGNSGYVGYGERVKEDLDLDKYSQRLRGGNNTDRFTDGLNTVNEQFNRELAELTEENVDTKIFNLGSPSSILLSAGVEDKPMKLYGNKIIKKMKKHGFALEELQDLPRAVANPIAVFNNYQREGNRTILTELRSQGKNIMVAVTLGKDGVDVDFNIVSSVFGKGSTNIVDWISKGYLAYVDKEKALNYLYFSESSISEATDNPKLSSATKIVKNFENPNINEEKLRNGYGSYTNSELSLINDPVAKMLGKSNRTEEDHKAFAERERQRMMSRISELADRLHLNNIEAVTDSNGLQGKKAKAKGFYSKSSGKITIVIPNHASVEDVEKTLLHEAVAHYGLRKLFGEHFETFLDNVYQNVEPEIRRIITSQAANNNWDFRTATEEYLAGLAERTDFERVHYTIWNKIKSLFLKMLHSIGFEGWSATELSDNELRYLLWRSYENMKEPDRYRSILGEAEDIAKQNELKVGNYELQDTDSSNVAERGILYREDDSEEKKRVNAREKYEQRVNRAMFQTQEALQDSMLALKEAMNAITKAEGKNVNIEDIDGYENAYLGENRLSSVNKAEADAFAHLLFKPMLAEVSKICKNAQERTELVDYMMAKHGLERNAVMRKRAIEDILNNEKLSDAQKNARAGLAEYRDYAGLTALTGKDNITEAEVDAEVMVSEYENTHDTTNLWDKVNTVNAAILSKSYECGMMNKDTYEKISDMYKYYIPLRGFDETTSEEAYAYLLHQNSVFNAPIKVAKGRSSKADDPFANMQSMAESAITQGNRNKLVKQRFFNFVLNHPSDLVSISDMWLKYDDVADEWKPVFPDNFEENDSAEDIEQKLKEFEDKMKKLAEQAPDKYKHGKETANIPYRVVDSRDLRQHQVLVKRGGRDYVLTLNGNPRAAQALNGQTNPDNDTSGAVGAILKAGEMVNRQLSAFYTTRNPDFVVSNFIRDMLYANSMVWVKESPNYALRFHRNIARCNPAQLKLLLAKHRKGTLDMNNKLEHMFYQFMMNGGETGYANVRDIEQHKNDIRRELKRANGKLSITKAFNLLGEKLDEYNRAVENCARFAAYLTSREMGRIVERSIYDAKEISVNFNKKGSGAKFMNAVGQTKIGTASAFVSGIGRSGFVFWNAAIQGTTNFGRQFKKHPTKAFTASAIMFLLGAVIAGIGMGDGDDDADANSYWNLPEYVRRSNILFKIGDQWVSIPLPVEYRAIYGMGELMVSAMSGKEHFTGSELGKAIAGQATQVLPIDFLEGGGGVKAFVPSAVKPFAEVYSNKGWTGMPIYKDTPYNKYMPEWTKAYKSANKYLVGIAKTLNGATGGDAYTKGSIDINPAQIEYLLNGYFGGVSGTIDKLSKSAETIAGDREYDPRDFLLLNRILKNGDERTEARAINNEYMRVKEEHDVLKARMKHYENDTDKGLFDYADKIDFLYNSPEFARYEIFEDYSKDIDALYKELKEANDGAEHLSIEKELTELKKEMIEEMNKTRK